PVECTSCHEESMDFDEPSLSHYCSGMIITGNFGDDDVENLKAWVLLDLLSKLSKKNIQRGTLIWFLMQINQPCVSGKNFLFIVLT
ncbi:hypothetical protein CEXT_697571, partial [Caerostris extrusa]